MFTQSEQKVKEVKFFDNIFALAFPSLPKSRAHNFTAEVEGVNYVLELLDSGRAQMTGYGKGIKRGDYIILTTDKIPYRVEAIDYYSSPPELWTALVVKV